MALIKPQEEQDEPSIVERLVLDAEIEAERLIGWVRLGLSLWLFAAVGLSFIVIDLLDMEMMFDLRAIVRRVGLPTQIAFFFVGLLALYCSSPRRWRPWMAYFFVTADALLIGASMYGTLQQAGLAGSFIAAVPPAAAVPVMFCIGSLRPRPRVQYYATALHAVLILAIVTRFGGLHDAEDLKATAANLPYLYEVPPNMLRLALLIAAGLTIGLGASRTRALLKRSVRETHRRKSLTRFLPAEIAPLVTDERFSAMRRGERKIATVMFVDIRDSTARAETLDPERLSVFISSFRRRVMRSVEAHDGIVDKFIGDGALVLFGVRESGGDGAADALDCARLLLLLVERWNAKRSFTPPIRVGIGIHTGEVYVGIVGDERRLEFTVLGDSVNIASRLEHLTKVIGAPLLASAATIEAAGEREGWQVMHDEPLRGRSASLAVLAPLGGARWVPALPPPESVPG